MKPKDIIFGQEARQKLAAGADKVAKAVVSTLGPRSRNVAINRPYYPHVVHDGVTVARSIKLKDPFEDMGAQLIKEAASNTNDGVGDGTTTSILLANTLIQEGIRLIDNKTKDGVIQEAKNPMELRDELMNCSNKILAQLDKMTKKIVSPEEITQIALISAQDIGIGTLTSEAVQKVGHEGIVMIEEGTTFKDEIEYQEGMDWDNGFLSPYFVTDPSRMVAEYSDGYVLLTDMTITDPNDLVPIIEKVRKLDNKPLLIVAGDVVGSALQTLVLSKLKGDYKLLAVVAPEFGERRKEVLEDIAILTAGTVVTAELDKKLVDLEIRDLGRFRKVQVDFRKTALTPSNPDPEEIKERIESIKMVIDREENNFVKERHRARLAKLSQGVAIIKVGGSSMAEIQERKERYIDAVHATKAAIEEGIVPGGGLALLNVMRDGDYPEIIMKMLLAPMQTILNNSGVDVEFEEYENDKLFDVVSGKKASAYETGIIDPVKVTKLAVRNAISVAAMLLTTDTLISEEEEHEKDNVPQG